MDDKTRNRPPPDPMKKTIMADYERLKMQEKMRDEAHKRAAKHALTEWTLVRSLAWSERLIVAIAALLFFLDKQHDFFTFSGMGFTIFSLLILGPIYGIVMFCSLLITYRIMKKLGNLPKNVAGFKKIIYPAYAIWTPFLYFLSYYAMKFYYDLLAEFPVWDKVKEMWLK